MTGADNDIVVEDLAGELDVVIGELANLGIVDAEYLRLLVGTEPQAGYHVDDEQDQSRKGEGVEAAGDGVGQLVAQLDPMVVKPTACNYGRAVEPRHGLACEEGRADVAHQASDSVYGKNVQRVVDSNQKLQLGGVVGARCAQNSINY